MRELSHDEFPDLAYFSSVSENIKCFVDKLDRPAVRIPLHPRLEGRPCVSCPYILIVPSYGGGDKTRAVPEQVVIFFSDPHNRALLRGITTSGNTSFGGHYRIAESIIAAKCHVPEFYRPELLGSDCDVECVNIGLQHFRTEIEADDTSNVPPANLHR